MRHLEREMELNGLEADEPLMKTQMTAVKQQTNTQNTKHPHKTQKQKQKLQTQYPTAHFKITNADIARMKAT